MTEHGTAAGWYDDPHGQAEKRYWDGQQWTDQVWPAAVAPAAAPSTAPPQAPMAAAGPSLASAGPGGVNLLGGLVAPIVGVVATVVLSVILGLEPEAPLFSSQFIGGGAGRVIGAILFGALFGAAIIGGPRLVSGLTGGGGLDQQALMPAALGAMAGAAAGLVVQVIGFKIIDEVPERLFDLWSGVPQAFVGGLYGALQWALFGACLLYTSRCV